MNSQQNCLNLDDRLARLPSSPDENALHGKYLSARSCCERQDTEEVTYENRIFNIKKKFTVPSPPDAAPQKRRASIINHHKIRAKPSEVFSKHSDVIVKNRRLLRRGVWEVPFEPDTVAEVRRPRYRTEQEESPREGGQAALLRSGEKRSQRQSARDLLESRTRQLPALRCSQEAGLPVRLCTRYGGKPLGYRAEDEGRALRNALSRKLAVELINYSLLGKWASSSLKL